MWLARVHFWKIIHSPQPNWVTFFPLFIYLQPRPSSSFHSKLYSSIYLFLLLLFVFQLVVNFLFFFSIQIHHFFSQIFYLIWTDTLTQFFFLISFSTVTCSWPLKNITSPYFEVLANHELKQSLKYKTSTAEFYNQAPIFCLTFTYFGRKLIHFMSMAGIIFFSQPWDPLWYDTCSLCSLPNWPTLNL